MSETDILVENAKAAARDRSPAVQGLRQDAAVEQEAHQIEAATRYMNSLQDPAVLADAAGTPNQIEPDDTDEGIATTPLTDDSFLPFSEDIPKQYNLGQQQLDDEASGNKREPGSYSNQYLKPDQITINGYDLASGQKHKNLYDLDPNRVQSSLDKIRNAEMNSEWGADVTGIEGAAEMADAILDKGLGYEQFKHVMEDVGMPEDQIRMAWGAADEARAQSELQEYLEGTDVSQEEMTAAQEMPEEKYTREDLNSLDDWQSAAATLYEAEEGQPWSGSPEDLTDWAVNEMSNFNWRIAGTPMINGSSMAYYASEALRKGGDYAGALNNLISIYDNTKTDFGMVKNSLGALATDPLTYAGIGVGKGASMIMAQVAKKRLQATLGKIAGGAAGSTGIGAVEGAGYAGYEQKKRQDVEMAAGARTEYDYGKVGKMAGMGAAVGGTAGALLSEPALKMYAKAFRQMRANAKKGQYRMPGSPMAQVGGVGNVGDFTPFKGVGAEDRVGTRVPSSPDAKENAIDDPLVVGIKSLSESDALEKNIKIMEGYDALRAHPDPNATLEERTEFIKQQLIDNLLWLHDQMDPALRERAKQWYNGARKKSEEWAEEYNLETRQVAAAIAALSPQKDWFQNMSMAERVMDIWTKFQDFQPNKAMIDEGDRIYLPNKAKHLETDNDRVKIAVWNDIKNKTLSELKTDYERGLWVRAFDQSNNPRSHRVWSPEGDMQDMALNNAGNELPTMWGSVPTIGNAIAAVRDGSKKNISKVIGSMHKVRNFYNNIVSPMSDRGEVTIDTHAVAAALMQPHGGSAKEVTDNLGGGAASALTGDAGTYGIFADAYREAAAQRGVLAREMQSITWEEVRTIFDNKSEAVKRNTKSVWNEYKRGTIEADEARRQVDEIARAASKSSSREPSWAAKPPGSNAGTRSSSYEKELSGDGLPRRDSPTDAGTVSGDTRRAEGERARRDALRSGVYSTARPRWTGDAKVRVYRGKSGAGDQGLRGVKQVFDLKDGGKGQTYRNLLKNTDLPTNPVYHELDAGDMAPTFQAGIADSAKNNKFGAAVHVYSPEEYAEMRLFQSPDGKSGFAIKDDGEIVSVYSPGGGNVFPMLQLAVEQGGTKLEAFDTVLPEIYEQAGFKVTKTTPWDDKHMPEGWDKETFAEFNNGEPAVVEMEYDPNYTKLADEGTPATEALDITPEAKSAWQEKRKAKVNKDRETGKGRDPTVRYEKVEEAAAKLEAGDISVKQFKNVVKKVDPPPIAKTVTEVPTYEEIAQSITKKIDETGIIGLNVSVPVGTEVSSRLDIPAYRQYGTWIPTIHEPTPQGSKAGKVMGYGQAAHLTDVKFGTTPKDAMKVAKGSAKYPFSTMDGKWASNDPVKSQKETAKIVKQMDDKGIYKDKDGNEWVQVGMNPARSSGYYVKGEYDKLELLSGAEEVIQVGSVVVAKNPTRVKLSDPDAAKKLGAKEGAALFSLLAAGISLGGEDMDGEPEA